jgi:hypothetical protein
MWNRRNFLKLLGIASVLPSSVEAAEPVKTKLNWRLSGGSWEATLGQYRLWCLPNDAPKPYVAGYTGIARYETQLPQDLKWYEVNQPHTLVWGKQLPGLSVPQLQIELENALLGILKGQPEGVFLAETL